MKRNAAYIFVLTFTLSFILSSCTFEDSYVPDMNANSSECSLSFIGDPMDRYKVLTRAGFTKDDEEKKINNIHVFFFNKDGEYLKGGYLTGYENAPEDGGYYALSEGVTSLKIDNEKFEVPSEAGSAIIYAVANVDPALFVLGENGLPENVRNLSDLENMDYSFGGSGVSLGIPEYGIPMVSKVQMSLEAPGTEKPGTEKPDTKGHIIELKSLMSRIDLNIRLESDVTDHNYPALTMVDWTAKNIPVKGAFAEPATGHHTGEKWSDSWTTSVTTPFQRTIYNKSGEIAISFYMFENIQSAEWKADPGETWQSEPDPDNPDPKSLYPEELIDNPDKVYQQQRYKPYLANRNATAVELHAFYSTYNESGSGTSTYEIRYTLYLGANHTNNFEVKRNHKYENNITIKGLTQVGTNPEHITFDARVNVSKDENDYYIAMLRERNHDAHFCVTPMDVYLFADASVKPTMEVILGEVPDGSEVPASIPDWIRMERICAADMEAGTVTQSGFSEYVEGSSGSGTHLATHASWHAGNGKRAFFTKDLVTNTLRESGKRVIIENTRDRVYFYIDENLQLQDRSAVVTLIYKENGAEVKRRTLKIEQTHLLPVQLREGKGTIYMEQYEEYLDHYDPLDEHRTDQIYDGLPWAEYNTYLWNRYINRLYRIEFGGAVYKPYDDPFLIINDGYAYSSFMIYLSQQGIMTLNDKPASSLQYCHNKNKRDNDGVINSSYGKTLVGYYWEKSNGSKWFLPGIRQMEDALTQYYTTFVEFQNNYYWSCSVGEREGYTDGQSPTQARATKVNPDGTYVESGGQKPKYPASGRADRTEKLRIRAFRVDLEPMQ